MRFICFLCPVTMKLFDPWFSQKDLAYVPERPSARDIFGPGKCEMLSGINEEDHTATEFMQQFPQKDRLPPLSLKKLPSTLPPIKTNRLSGIEEEEEVGSNDIDQKELDDILGYYE